MQKWCFGHRGLLILTLACSFALPAFAKKDFKGLFGSYRRQNFTENEANSTDVGLDLMLSTLLPVTSMVQSSEDGTNYSDMYYSTFFNVEGSVFFTLSYNWEVFANFGYYNYDTRKQNTARSIPTLPLYHEYSMTSFPVVGGIKYRFGTSDIVPYLGVGAGVSFVHRKGYYDNTTQTDEDYPIAPTVEVIAGLEFFFAAKMGIRLEASAYYMVMSQRDYTQGGGTPQTIPYLRYMANPISMRYASGLFFLF